MPGKDFEQQVRDQLDHWGQDPSEAVWTKLEQALIQKKRRRRFAYMFLLAVLLAGAGLWGSTYLHGSASESSTPVIEQRTQETGGQSAEHSQAESAYHRQQHPAAGSQATLAEGGQVLPEGGSQAALAEGGEVLPEGGSQVALTETRQPQSAEQAAKRSGSRPKPALISADMLRTGQGSGYFSPSPNGTIRRSDKMQSEPSPRSSSVADAPGVPKQETISAVPPVTTGATTNLPVESGKQASVATPLPPTGSAADAPIVRVGKRSQLQWGVSAGLGKSMFSDGLSLMGQKSADMANSPGSGGTPSVPTYYAYQQNPATGYELGAWMRLGLSRRWQAQAGLTYQQWKTETPVGVTYTGNRNYNNGMTQLNSSTGFSSGRQDTYRNQYQMLNVPIGLEWQINAGRRLPLIWSATVLPGWLLSSNALTGAGDTVLYHHAQNQQRFQFGLRTGFMFRLFPSSAHALDIGPVFQYQLNQVFLSSIEDNGHLAYLGIEARLPLFSFGRKQR